MLKPKRLVNKNFLSSLDISKEEFLDILDLAKNFKNKTLELKFKDKDGKVLGEEKILKSLYDLLIKLSKEEKKTIEGLKKLSYSMEFDYVFDDYKKVEEVKEKLYPLLDNLTPTQFTINIVESIKSDLVDF